MPCIDFLLDKVGQARFFSTLDHTKAYWQISLRRENREKTGFPCPSGLYQFTKMPFRLHGVLATFQRQMDWGLQPVVDCALGYIDDIKYHYV